MKLRGNKGNSESRQSPQHLYGPQRRPVPLTKNRVSCDKTQRIGRFSEVKNKTFMLGREGGKQTNTEVRDLK